jgi:hypothetical protein
MIVFLLTSSQIIITITSATIFKLKEGRSDAIGSLRIGSWAEEVNPRTQSLTGESRPCEECIGRGLESHYSQIVITQVETALNFLSYQSIRKITWKIKVSIQSLSQSQPLSNPSLSTPSKRACFLCSHPLYFLLINLTLFYLIIILTNISHSKSVIIKRFPDI